MVYRYHFILSVTTIALLFTFSQFSKAQKYLYSYDIFGTNQLMEKIYNEKGEYSTNQLDYDVIEGNPFLWNEFIKGEILTTDSILYTDIELRYDTYSESMQINYKNKIFTLDNTLDIKQIKIQDQYFHRLNHIDNSDSLNTYFKLLVDDSCRLYVRYKVKFYDKEKSNGFNTPKPARFGKIYSNYYISTNTSLQPIDTKKIFFNFIRDDGELKAYIKKEKLKFNNEDDLIKIIKYYNHILLL